MKRYTAIGCFLFGLLLIACAQGPDEQYLRVYNLIQEADRLSDSGSSRQALEKYTEAQAALRKLKEVYPSWNEKVISYRLNYVETKLAPLAARFPAPSAPSAQPAKETVAPRPAAAPSPEP